MEYMQLGNTDMRVSHLSYGASALGSMYRTTNEQESINVVHEAIRCGINYIDTAPWYGQGLSEVTLGKAFQDIPREKYFLATKVGRYETDPGKMFDFSAEKTFRSVDESLQRLGVGYVDVIQVHDMEFAPDLNIIINETLPALKKIQDAGKARYIGITGYPLDNFRTVLDQSSIKIDTVLTYCRYSMNDTSLTDYLPYFKEKGVGVINASPISMSLLSQRGPPKWHPATNNIKDVCQKAAQFCQNAGQDISRLALDFTLQQKDIPTTLVSTASLTNLKGNIEVAVNGISTKEREVQSDCYEKFFKPLCNANWEGVEVARYRNDIAFI